MSRVGVLTTVRNVWRKNAPEVIGMFDGSLPAFVTARQPRDIGSSVPIFCYHLVEPERFRADLQFLQNNGYRTLSATAFLEHLQGKRQAPERSVLLTFDDGPKNFYDVAFPLLKEFDAHVLAFIAPGLHAEAGVDANIELRPMDWREIGEIHRSGLVEFHSHTFESRYVPGWPRPASLCGCEPALEESRRSATPLSLRDDLQRSREMLESRLPGFQVKHLSFPQYIGTPEAVELAQSLGFEACHWGYIPQRPMNKPGDSPFFISRTSDEFLQRLPGTGRATMIDMVRERLHRIREARAWRRRYPH